MGLQSCLGVSLQFCCSWLSSGLQQDSSSAATQLSACATCLPAGQPGVRRPADTGCCLQTLASVQSYQHTANNVSNTYRPLAIGLLFGLIMLASLLVCVCACIARTPRLTAFLLVILWIFTGAIFFIGSGEPCLCALSLVM